MVLRVILLTSNLAYQNLRVNSRSSVDRGLALPSQEVEPSSREGDLRIYQFTSEFSKFMDSHI